MNNKTKQDENKIKKNKTNYVRGHILYYLVIILLFFFKNKMNQFFMCLTFTLTFTQIKL